MALNLALLALLAAVAMAPPLGLTQRPGRGATLGRRDGISPAVWVAWMLLGDRN
jgi:hypothetical protein